MSNNLVRAAQPDNLNENTPKQTHAELLTYWDYIQTERLLSLQQPRTDYKDEEVFIMYHQITELILKMILHEIRQLCSHDQPESVWIDKLSRINRYVSMLITSFDVMKSGMSHEDYNMFRRSLSPASGFQSVQFRHIELYCTRLQNLVNAKGKAYLPEVPSTEEYFHYIYWQDAGLNRETGEKSPTLKLFEDKYLDSLIALADSVRGITLEEKVLGMNMPSDRLTEALRSFDHLYNVAWPMVHLQTATYYLDRDGKQQQATGGSNWQKYLDPAHQQRRFFPHLWSGYEIEHWGKHYQTNHIHIPL